MNLVPVWDIIDKIWELPWYKVLIIAAVDDFILFLKIWPIYFVLLVAVIIFLWRMSKTTKEKTMTKSELIELMEGTSDDIEIFIDIEGLPMPIVKVDYQIDPYGYGIFVLKT